MEKVFLNGEVKKFQKIQLPWDLERIFLVFRRRIGRALNLHFRFFLLLSWIFCNVFGWDDQENLIRTLDSFVFVYDLGIGAWIWAWSGWVVVQHYDSEGWGWGFYCRGSCSHTASSCLRGVSSGSTRIILCGPLWLRFLRLQFVSILQTNKYTINPSLLAFNNFKIVPF